MKHGVTLALGIALGVAAGLAALYYNPLTDSKAPEPNDSDWALHYAVPFHDALLVTHGNHRRIAAKPAGVPELWEHTINGMASLMLTLSDSEDKPVAIASRLSLPSSKTDLLLHGAVWMDYWIVTVPGQGSLFLQIESNVWPFVKDSLVPVWLFRREWRGPTEYRPTIGPGLRSTALVLGATGRFAELEGSAVERYELRRFTTAGAEDLVGELYLHLVEPIVAARD